MDDDWVRDEMDRLGRLMGLHYVHDAFGAPVAVDWRTWARSLAAGAQLAEDPGGSAG